VPGTRRNGKTNPGTEAGDRAGHSAPPVTATDAGTEHSAGPERLSGSCADTVAVTDPAALRDEKFRCGLEVVLDGLALCLSK